MNGTLYHTPNHTPTRLLYGYFVTKTALPISHESLCHGVPRKTVYLAYFVRRVLPLTSVHMGIRLNDKKPYVIYT